MSLQLSQNLAKLPETCYSVSLIDETTIVLKRGETGYYETGYGVQGEDAVNSLNARMGVSRQQRAAMELGSMVGFHAPGANPDMYGEDGKFKRTEEG